MIGTGFVQRSRHGVGYSVFSCVLALSFAAGVSDVAAQQEAGVIEEVIVTAQKREQNIQDVGISITTFSGDQIERLGYVESTELAALSPGVSVSASAGDQSRQFSIRGVTQNDFADHTESPNAVYVDEGYIAAPQGQVFALFDLDRVEVLRGPQGTLFGRNATGGLVHYQTRKPTFDFDAYANVTVGSYNQIKTEGAVSGPLTDKLAARASFMYNRHDEIIDNNYPQGNSVNALTGADFVPSPSGQDDYWNDDQMAGRVQFLYEPSDDLRLLVSGFASRQEVSTGAQQQRPVTAILNDDGSHVDSIFAANDPQGCEAISQSTGGCLPISFLDGEIPGVNEDAVRPAPGTDLFGYRDADGGDFDASLDHALDDFNRYRVHGLTANIEWDLGGALTLDAISHYAYYDKRQTLDVDVSPAPQSLVLQEAEHDTFSQELRLSGDFDRFSWVGGLYYLYIDVDYAQGLAFSPDSPISHLFFGGEPTESPIFVDMQTDSYSAFTHFDVFLTDRLSLVAGARLIREEKDYDYENQWFPSIRDETIDSGQNPLPIPVDPAGGGARMPSFSDSSSDTLWSGKVQLNYRPQENLLVYGGYRRGIKAGGFNAKLNDFNPAPLDSEVPYDEEVLDAWEAGFKWTFLNDTTRLNGSAYYYDYQDYQAFVFTGSSGLIKNRDAEYNGLELELSTVPMAGLNVNVGVSYIDAEVQDLEIAPGVFRDVRPTFTPEWQLSGLVRYDLPFGRDTGIWSVQADVSYQSDRHYNIRNFHSDLMDDYTLVNLQLSWLSLDGRWQATGFVQNATDERYKIGGFDLATLCGCSEEAYGKPRWYGLRVSYNH